MLECNVIFKLTLVFFLLMGKIIRSRASVNVGTVLFDANDADKHCWAPRGELLLNARQLMQNMLPDQLHEGFDKSYVTEFIDYVYNTLGIIRSTVHGEAQQALVLALCDVIGGYMRVYLLPMSKNEYYNGNFAYNDMLKLYDVYQDVKAVLRTDGSGWNMPIALSSDLDNLPSLRVSKRTMTADACSPFLFNKGRALNTSSIIPLPYLDDDLSPHSIAVPFRNHSLRSLQAKTSANLLTKYYVTGMKCLLATASEEEFRNFNAKVESWVKSSVQPHLDEEEWYPAFGGVNRVLATARRVRTVLSETSDMAEENLRGFRGPFDGSAMTGAFQRSLKQVTRVLEDAMFQRSANEAINGITNLWQSKHQHTDINEPVSSIILSNDDNYPPSRGVISQISEENPSKTKSGFRNRNGYAPSRVFAREGSGEEVSFTNNPSVSLSANDPSVEYSSINWSPKHAQYIATPTPLRVSTQDPNSRFLEEISSQSSALRNRLPSASLERDFHNFNNYDRANEPLRSKSKDVGPERISLLKNHHEIPSGDRASQRNDLSDYSFAISSVIPISSRTYHVLQTTIPSSSQVYIARTTPLYSVVPSTHKQHLEELSALYPISNDYVPLTFPLNNSLSTHSPQMLFDYIPPTNSPYQYVLSNSVDACSNPFNSTFTRDTQLLQLTPEWTKLIDMDNEMGTGNSLLSGMTSTVSTQQVNPYYKMNLEPYNGQNPSINFIPTSISNLNRGNLLRAPIWSQNVSGDSGFENSNDFADRNSTGLEFSYYPIASLTSPGGISTRQIASLHEYLLQNTLAQVPNNGFSSRIEYNVKKPESSYTYYDFPSNMSLSKNPPLTFSKACTSSNSQFDEELSDVSQDLQNLTENTYLPPIKSLNSNRSWVGSSSFSRSNEGESPPAIARLEKMHKNALRQELLADSASHQVVKAQKVRAVHDTRVEEEKPARDYGQDSPSSNHLNSMKLGNPNSRLKLQGSRRDDSPYTLGYETLLRNRDNEGYILSEDDRKENNVDSVDKKHIYGNLDKNGNMFDETYSGNEAKAYHQRMTRQRNQPAYMPRLLEPSNSKNLQSSNHNSVPDDNDVSMTNSTLTSTMSLQMQNSMVKAAVMEEYIKENMQKEKEEELSQGRTTKDSRSNLRDNSGVLEKEPMSVGNDDKFSTRNSFRFGKHGHPKGVIQDKKSMGLFRHHSGKSSLRKSPASGPSTARKKGKPHCKQHMPKSRGPWELNDADDYKEDEDEDEYAVENYKKAKNIDFDDECLRQDTLKVRRHGSLHGHLYGDLRSLNDSERHGTRLCWFMFRVVKQEVSTLIISPDLALTNFIMTILFWFVLWFSYFLLTGRTCPCVDNDGEGCQCGGKGMQCIPLGGDYYMVKCPCGEQSYLKTTEVKLDKGDYGESEDGGWASEKKDGMSQTSQGSFYSESTHAKWPNNEQYHVETVANVLASPHTSRTDRFEMELIELPRAKSESNKTNAPRSKNRRSSSSSNMDDSWERKVHSSQEYRPKQRSNREEVIMCEPNVPVWRDVEPFSRGTSEPAYSAPESRDDSPPKSVKMDSDWNPKVSFHNVEHAVQFVTPISHPMQSVSFDRSSDQEHSAKAIASASQCSCHEGASVVREVEVALEVIRQASHVTELTCPSELCHGRSFKCPRHGIVTPCPRIPRPTVGRCTPRPPPPPPLAASAPVMPAHRSAITRAAPCLRHSPLRPMSSYPQSKSVQASRPLPPQQPASHNAFVRSPSASSVRVVPSRAASLAGATQTDLVENGSEERVCEEDEEEADAAEEPPDAQGAEEERKESQRIVRPTRLCRSLRESEKDRLSQILAVQLLDESEDSLMSPSIERDRSRSDSLPSTKEMKDKSEGSKQMSTKDEVERRLDSFFKERVDDDDDDKYAPFPNKSFRVVNTGGILEELIESESSASYLSDVIEDVTGERRTSSEEEDRASVLEAKPPSRTSLSPTTSGPVSQASETSTVKRNSEKL